MNMSSFNKGYIGVQGYDPAYTFNSFVYDNFTVVTNSSKTKAQNIIDLSNMKGSKGDPEGNDF